MVIWYHRPIKADLLTLIYSTIKEIFIMKENYEALEMEVIEFETEDVITTSGGLGGGGNTD